MGKAVRDNQTIDAVIKLLDVGFITYEDLRSAPAAQPINLRNLPGRVACVQCGRNLPSQTLVRM